MKAFDESYNIHTPVMCLGIATPKNIKFSIVPSGKLIIFRCPVILANNSLTIISLSIGTPKTINFPFGTNGKSMILSVPILKHLRVYVCMQISR